jgi:hypothetical protein
MYIYQGLGVIISDSFLNPQFLGILVLNLPRLPQVQYLPYSVRRNGGIGLKREYGRINNRI